MIHCKLIDNKFSSKTFRKSMSMAGSTQFSEVLYTLTGKREIKADALLEYYDPLIKWLEKLVIEFNIPLGW